MEENSKGNKVVDKAKEVAKSETKKLVGEGIKKILRVIGPYIIIFFAILLAIGFINAVQHTIIDWITSIFKIKKGETRTTSKGTYSNTIIGAAQEVHDDEIDWLYYTEHDKGLSSLKSPVYLQLINSDKATCCASYVGCVLYASGYFSSEEIGNNFHQPHILNELLSNYGWQKITDKSEFQAGDIVFCDKDNDLSGIDHVQIYAGDNKWYNAGNTYDIQHSAPKQGRDNWDADYAVCWAYRATEGPRYDPPERKVLATNSERLVELDENGRYKLIEKDLSKKILEMLKEKKVNNKLEGFTAEDNSNKSSSNTTTTGDDKSEEISDKELQDMIDKYIKVDTNTSLPGIYEGLFPKILYEYIRKDINGMIKVQKASVEGNKTEIKPLEYKKYDDFENLSKDKIYDYFSLTDDFELCIARPGSTITYTDENGAVVSSVALEEKDVIIEKIPYENYIKNYIVPFNFLISLHVISQDKDFMDDVVDMALCKAKEEPMILTYVESKYINTETIEYTGKKITVKKGDDMDKAKVKNIDNSNVRAEFGDISGLEISSYVKKEEVSYTGQLYVTKADTWILTSEKTIDEKESGEVQEPEIEDLYSSKREVTDDDENINIVSKTLTKKTTEAFSSIEYVVVDGNFEIKVDDFIDLIKSYPTVENNIASAPSDLFYMLQQRENTLVLEKVMRYVLYKLNDIDYGITEKELEFLFSDSFNQVDIISNIDSYVEQFYRKQRNAEDDEYYKLVKNTNDELVIGKINLNWEENSTSFSIKGTIKHDGQEKEVDNIADYINNAISDSNNTSETLDIWIEKEIVDNICENILETLYKDLVDNDLFALGLSRQQTYALLAVKYSYGCLPVIDGRTFKKVYKDGMQEFEEGSWQHNKYIWDNWWYQLGKTSTATTADAQYETYIKGVFDFSLSDAGGVFSRNKYIFYSQEQISEFENATDLSITRTSENEEEIFTLELKAGEFEKVDGQYIVGYYTSTTGRRFTILCQSKIPGWGGKCNRAATAIIASGYSKEEPSSLIATMNTYYNDIIPSGKYMDIYGLKRGPYTGSMTVAEYTKRLREQLQKGGYACIWVNKGQYYGKSGMCWTNEIHWVAILDYKAEGGKEKIFIADWRGGAWYDIDEFSRGISNYCEISEK